MILLKEQERIFIQGVFELMKKILASLGEKKYFGILANASTTEISVYAKNQDTTIGDLYLIPCDRRGGMKEYAQCGASAAILND